MSRTVDMLALTLLIGCRVQAPAKPCDAVMLGACVDPPPARARCERGRARDLDDGSCATTRDTRDLARALGLFVDENDTIACESKDDELVASGRLGKIGCIAREGHSSSDPVAPVPTSRGGTVDVPRWAHAAAALLCEELTKSSAVLRAPETTFEVELEVVVPDNDLTQGYVRGRSLRGGGELEPILRRIDDALRRLGGTASASDVRAAATCRAWNHRPVSLP